MIFELGGVPTEAKYLNMTEEQWTVLGAYSLYKKEQMIDAMMDGIEYLAMLVTPHPKEAMKVIEGRRKESARVKREAGVSTEGDGSGRKKLFTEEHRNTTFYDEVEKMVGKEAADALRKEDKDNSSSTEAYDLEFEDLEYIEKARKAQQEYEIKKKKEESLNSVRF